MKIEESSVGGGVRMDLAAENGTGVCPAVSLEIHDGVAVAATIESHGHCI